MDRISQEFSTELIRREIYGLDDVDALQKVALALLDVANQQRETLHELGRRYLLPEVNGTDNA